ncbi:hypothetical protein E8L99_16925 [Phreatobacter aquaticus]|uniref:Uncharacterized protein n=2 Tax=Phreatobacter aquaticus TaxID=2570229 RepID=A0A4D7QNA1_9HYPH|nr:hypothetical protein E8L99_16925 [Phreatobacter aquaticus]
MSHRGSVLALPSGIRAWDVTAPGELTAESLGLVLAEAAEIDFLLIGTGVAPVLLSDAIAWPLRDARIGFDVMATGAAARTFNIMLGERRRVAAALIAVD